MNTPYDSVLFNTKVEGTKNGRASGTSGVAPAASVLVMIVSWDKTDDRIWYAVWEDGDPTVRLYFVVERLPLSTDWDWSVWEASAPLIVRRGVAPSALQGEAAAEAAAAVWWLGKRNPKKN